MNFLHKAYHRLLVGKNRRQHKEPFATVKSPTKTTQKCEQHGTKSRKGHLFVVWELMQDGRELPCSISAGSVHVVYLKKLVSADDWEHAASTDFGVTNKFDWVGGFVNNVIIMTLDCTMKSCERSSFSGNHYLWHFLPLCHAYTCLYNILRE